MNASNNFIFTHKHLRKTSRVVDSRENDEATIVKGTPLVSCSAAVPLDPMEVLGQNITSLLLTLLIISGGWALEPAILAKESNSQSLLASSTRKNIVTTINSLESSLTIISHNSFAKNHQFCRLKGICRLGDGTLILPKWMKPYSAHVAKCGIANVVYNIIEAEEGQEQNFMSLQEMDTKVSLNDTYRHFDVIGNEAPRVERSLLATDITPSILLLDLFKRPGAYGQQIQFLCTTKHGTACRPENGSDPSSFNPMVFVDARVSETKQYLWPKSFLRLFRNAANGRLNIMDLKDVYGWKIRSEASCFRSLITTNAQTADIASDSLLPSHLFFSMNKLSRREIGPSSNGALMTTCGSKVLILNRYGKRFIEGSDMLRSAISSYGTKLRQKHSHVLIEPEVVFFENSSFHEQVSVAQESDIVVASHGDGNANFVFLRPKSRVFEILPFGFKSTVYQNLSRAYGSTYSSVCAQPDSEVFLACVKHFNNVDTEEKEGFLKAWQAAAEHFRTESRERKENVGSDFTVPEDNADRDHVLRRLKQCASHQRISVNVKHLARMVVKAAAEKCQLEGGIEFLNE